MRKGTVHLVIDGHHLAPERFEEMHRGHHAGTVAAIDRHLEVPPANGISVDGAKQGIDVLRNGKPLAAQRLDAVPARESELALVDDIQQFLALIGAQKAPRACHKLQRVPVGRVMAGGDGHPTGAACCFTASSIAGVGQTPRSTTS